MVVWVSDMINDSYLWFIKLRSKISWSISFQSNATNRGHWRFLESVINSFILIHLSAHIFFRYPPTHLHFFSDIFSDGVNKNDETRSIRMPRRSADRSAIPPEILRSQSYNSEDFSPSTLRPRSFSNSRISATFNPTLKIPNLYKSDPGKIDH